MFAGEIDTYQVWKLAICLLQFQCPSEPSLTSYISNVPRKVGVERTRVPESCQVCLETRVQAREFDARSSGACGRRPQFSPRARETRLTLSVGAGIHESFYAGGVDVRAKTPELLVCVDEGCSEMMAVVEISHPVQSRQQRHPRLCHPTELIAKRSGLPNQIRDRLPGPGIVNPAAVLVAQRGRPTAPIKT